MKNNDEMFQSVISRLDLYLEQKEKKKLYIRRFAPVIASLCFAFVICFAVWDGKKPDPLPEIDNMIVTETTSANTTALPQITEKNITSITEAVTTSLNVRSDTTVSSVNTTQVSSNITQVTSDPHSHIVSVVTTESVHSDTVITSASITKTSTINTTIRTTARTTVNTTSGTTIRTTARTTVNTTNRTTIRTTVRTTVNSTTTILTTTEYSGAGNEHIAEEQWAQLPINQRYYNAYIYGYDDVYVNGYRIPSDIVGDLIDSAEMHSQKRIDGKIKKCTAEAYFIYDYSDDIVVAIKFEDSDQYYLYCNQNSDIYEIRKIIPPQQ